MKRPLAVIMTIVILSLASVGLLYAQAENVPVSNPVYTFLKRMEVKGVIEQYHDAVLPISRKQTAEFLIDVAGKLNELTITESKQLVDFFVEYKQDIVFVLKTQTAKLPELLSKDNENSASFGNREKHIYEFEDENVTMTIDGLLSLDARKTSGDTYGNDNAEFVQFGGRIRGTIYDKVGYYLQGTNAQFWGSRAVLQRDKIISQAYTLGILDAQNFDVIEGYMRYDGGILSAQVGRDRTMWGTGYGDKLIISDNVRMFDAIRADVEYKAFKYSFLHGWLLGKKSLQTFGTVTEPVVADKYIGVHRIQAAFPHITIGFQEMALYSNRSVDLAYLNPVTLIESAQRSREERDNVLWAFDCKLHPLRNIEVQGTLLLDDLNFPKLGTSSYQNKFAMQGGILFVDPLTLSNTALAIEYTRVNPYTFSHERSRDNDYGSFYRILSHHIGPNSDSWFVKFDVQPTYRLFASVRCELQREGENSYDSTGVLIKNVGGDFLIPHRDTDPQEQEFLEGNRIDTRSIQAYLSYEVINQFTIDAQYKLIYRKSDANSTTDHEFGVALRVDF